MRIAAFILALMLAGCGPSPYHMTDIAGAMPRLDFDLTRAGDGKSVDGASFRGHPVALYFGYTNCPDVCPATLANLTSMMAKLGDRNFRVLFVTVDPNRDTPAILNQYVHAFSPQMVGLRGSPNALADLARRYRVAYSVDPKPPYTVTHSSAVFFFDAKGNARLVTTDTSDPDAMAEDMERMLKTS
jgi:protein SCO1/2